MQQALLNTYTSIGAWRTVMLNKIREEHGEGVISAAIAVLIMAAVGAIAYVGFQTFWNTTQDKAQAKIDSIP